MSELPPFLLFDLDDTIVRFSSGPGDLWEELSGPFAPRLGVDPEKLLAALHQAAGAFWSDPVTMDAGRLELVVSRAPLALAEGDACLRAALTGLRTAAVD